MHDRGWAWFEGGDGAPEAVPAVCVDAAVCFASPQGGAVLAHLERLFLARRLTPRASDAELRHLEGQRSVVAYLLALRDRGRADPDTSG